MTAKRTPDSFLRLLENNVRTILKNKDATVQDRLKAVEIGSKLAAIQAKAKGGDEDAFFG